MNTIVEHIEIINCGMLDSALQPDIVENKTITKINFSSMSDKKLTDKSLDVLSKWIPQMSHVTLAGQNFCEFSKLLVGDM